MQKYHSTLYRKVLLIFVQLLHTNMRNMYISKSVFASHRPSRPTVQDLFFFLVFFRREHNPKAHGRGAWRGGGGGVQVWLGGACAPGGLWVAFVWVQHCKGEVEGASSILRKVQEWTLKASSCSECMLLSERRSGSLSSSLVKIADSLGWFLVMRLRRARISVS